METKICKKCKREFPATTDFFGREKKRKDGLKSQCKECIAAQKREYWGKNKEKLYKQQLTYKKLNRAFKSDVYFKIKESKKEYYSKNRDKILEWSKNYYSKYKEQYIKRYKGKYRNKYKEKSKEYNHKWRQKNKEKIRIYKIKRENKKINLPSNLTSEQWEKINKSFNNCCAYCGKSGKMTVEHFIPISKGGEFTINNILPVCLSCNSSKKDRDFKKWYKLQEFYSLEREKNIYRYLGYKKDKQQLKLI
jgi:5-methylcytosine-specific restriction endonuclease McrA